LGSTKGRNDLEDLGVDGRIILKCALKKCVARMWTVIGSDDRFCEDGN
jgi:hypothetical protein